MQKKGRAGRLKMMMMMMPIWLVFRLSTPARPVLDHSSAAHETVAQHVHLHARSRSGRPLLSANALLYMKAPRCAHDATCSNVVRTGGLDAPFLFIFFTSWHLLVFAQSWGCWRRRQCVCMCVRKKSRGGKECVWVDVCFHVMTQKEWGKKLVLKFHKSKSQT